MPGDPPRRPPCRSRAAGCRVAVLALALAAASPAAAAGGGASAGGAGSQRAINSGLPDGEAGPPGAPNNRNAPAPGRKVRTRGSPRTEGR